MLRIAVLGCGRIGQMHAANVARHPRATLVAVYDVNAQAAGTVARALGVKAAGSAAEVFADANVDAVLVATATPTHADFIEMAIAAGKAVLCEKPIDLNLSRVNACAAKIGNTSIPIQLGFNRRYDPGHSAARNAMLAGEIGDLHQVIITSRDPGAPPADYITRSGGIFRDMTIHDFDMARFLLGEEIATVSAVASVLVDPKIGELGDFDSVSVILTTATGKQCIIGNSRRATYGYDQRIEVHGALGSVSAENQRPVSIEVASAKGYTRPPLHDFFMTRYTEAYAAEIAAFIAAILGKAKAAPTGEDGLAALALAEAALKSVAEKRAVLLSEVMG